MLPPRLHKAPRKSARDAAVPWHAIAAAVSVSSSQSFPVRSCDGARKLKGTWL